MKQPTKIITFTAIIIMIMGLSVLAAYLNRQTLNRNNLTAIETLRENYSYAIKPVGDRLAGDNEIVRISTTTRKEEVLLASVKKAANLTRYNETLAELAIPENSNKIFLQQITNATDSPAKLIWSFDVQTKKLDKLVNINKAYDGFGGTAISPNKLYLIQAPDNEGERGRGISQTLKLFDLSGDSVKTLLTLSGNETFNSGYGGLSSNFEITWLNNSEIQYSVYDQSVVSGRNTEVKKPLIATRILKIK